MHHEFAVESYEYHVNNFDTDADFIFIRTWCLEPEMMSFAEKSCDDKTRDIIATIKGMTGRRKPTTKQQAAIALAMLEGRTAKDILLAVYGEKVKALLDMEEETAVVIPEVAAASVKSELFKAAWSIARTAAAKFGGSVKSYLAESLKMAYNQQTKKRLANILEAA